MWKRIAKMCEWEKLRAPAVRLMFDDVRAAPAVLSFLRDTQVGGVVPLAPRGGWGAEDTSREVDGKGAKGGPGPP